MPAHEITSGSSRRIGNAFISEKLDEVADLLAAQHAGPFRVRAYRDAAAYVARSRDQMQDIYATGGRDGLEALPTIGSAIAAAIAEMIDTGQLALIARLRGEIDPEAVFRTVPMIGPKLAETIHDDLGIDTLEELEAAAHDGRLRALPGIGDRRARSIQHSLAEILAWRGPHRHRAAPAPPPVEVVLDVDAEYRASAARDLLPKIAPRRFNPGNVAWLPILHTIRGPWRFTALFSNTANAHRRGRTHDWVVVHFERDGAPEGQCTVITARRGPLAGQRIVRGREDEQPVPRPAADRAPETPQTEGTSR